jgi:hypothetical protein
MSTAQEESARTVLFLALIGCFHPFRVGDGAGSAGARPRHPTMGKRDVRSDIDMPQPVRRYRRHKMTRRLP